MAKALAGVAPLALKARAGRDESGLHHRDVTKAALLRALFTGRDASWLAEQGESYSRELPKRLRQEMVEQVEWHRDQGHELVLVSASLGTYLRPFARDHGFDHVIAVEMQEDATGVLTGEMTGPNVRGPEKAIRLKAWLGEARPESMWAYGNSSGDTELLAMADVPVWVGRAASKAAAT